MSLFRDTSITLGGRWLGVAAAAASGLVVATCAGPQGAGTFAMVRIAPAAVAALLGAGLTTATPYLIGGGHRSAQAVGETAAALGILLGAIGWGVWVALGGILQPRFFPHLSSAAVVVVGSAILLNLLRDYLNSVQQGLQHFGEAAAVLCLDDVCSLLLLLPLFAGTSNPGPLIVVSSVAGVAASVIAAVVMLVRGGVRPWPRLHLAIARDAFRFGLKSHVGRLANVLTWRLDVLILSSLASVEVVGCYAVASKVAELFRPLGASLSAVLRPVLAGVPPAEARRRGILLYRQMFAINLVAVALMALCGGPLILHLFGGEFAPAVPAFHILLIGLAAYGADPVLNGYNVGIGRPEYNTYTALAGLAVTVVGDVALIPGYSLIGAAITSSVAYTTKSLVFTVIFLSTARVSCRELVGVKEYSPDPA